MFPRGEIAPKKRIDLTLRKNLSLVAQRVDFTEIEICHI